MKTKKKKKRTHLQNREPLPPKLVLARHRGRGWGCGCVLGGQRGLSVLIESNDVVTITTTLNLSSAAAALLRLPPPPPPPHRCGHRHRCILAVATVAASLILCTITSRPLHLTSSMTVLAFRRAQRPYRGPHSSLRLRPVLLHEGAVEEERVTQQPALPRRNSLTQTQIRTAQ